MRRMRSMMMALSVVAVSAGLLACVGQTIPDDVGVSEQAETESLVCEAICGRTHDECMVGSSGNGCMDDCLLGRRVPDDVPKCESCCEDACNACPPRKD